jgi:hypothetical protein
MEQRWPETVWTGAALAHMCAARGNQSRGSEGSADSYTGAFQSARANAIRRFIKTRWRQHTEISARRGALLALVRSKSGVRRKDRSKIHAAGACSRMRPCDWGHLQTRWRCARSSSGPAWALLAPRAQQIGRPTRGRQRSKIHAARRAQPGHAPNVWHHLLPNTMEAALHRNSSGLGVAPQHRAQ